MNQILFDTETHTYTNETGKTLISTTQLMRKHGLAPDYSNVSAQVLQKKAEYGTSVHEAIENYCRTGMIDFSSEHAQYIVQFDEYLKDNNLEVVDCEFIVANDIVAGTIDLLLKNKATGELIYADNKTTYDIHKDAVSWQISIYKNLDYHSGTISNDCYCFWYHKDKLDVVKLPRKQDEEVERLFECERQGELFSRDISVVDIQLQKLSDLELEIQTIETSLKDLKARKDEYTNALKDFMIANGHFNLESEKLKVTLVAEQNGLGWNTAAMEKDDELVKLYKTKKTHKNAYVLVSVKKEDSDGLK